MYIDQAGERGDLLIALAFEICGALPGCLGRDDLIADLADTGKIRIDGVHRGDDVILCRLALLGDGLGTGVEARRQRSGDADDGGLLRLIRWIIEQSGECVLKTAEQPIEISVVPRRAIGGFDGGERVRRGLCVGRHGILSQDGLL